MAFTKYTTQKDKEQIRINEAIRADEVRVIGPNGENVGVLSLDDAIERAMAAGMDLIEVSARANPPVARIADYGKYKYELKKKERDIKQNARVVETKVVQVKIGTSEGDAKRKASNIAEWLQEGHRAKIDLFLWGRYKYMEESFLRERLDQFLAIIPESYKIAEPVERSPKGFSVVIEPDKSKLKKDAPEKAEKAPETDK